MTFTVRGIVSGKVQGVGFRDHIKKAVSSTSIVGHALNLPDGTVELLLVGHRDEVAEIQKTAQQGPRYARVDNIDWQMLDGVSADGFRVG